MIDSTTTGRLGVVTLHGEFDLVNAGEIRETVSALIAGGCSDITVDLSPVTFVDVSAVNALVAVNAMVDDIDGRLVLVGISPFVLRILAVTELSQLLPAFAPGRAERRHRAPDAPVPPALVDLTDEFQTLATLLSTEQSLTASLERIVRAAVETVPSCTAASTALVVQGRPRTAMSSDHVAIEVDVARYVTEEGPWLTATRTGQRIRVDLLEVDDRYARMAPLAVQSGVRSTLTSPIVVDSQTVGSLNLYADRPQAFDAVAEALADVLAAQAALSIEHSALYAATRRLTDMVQQRSEEEQDIAVAEGVVSMLHTCSVEQAGRLLRQGAGSHALLVGAARRILEQLRP